MGAGDYTRMGVLEDGRMDEVEIRGGCVWGAGQGMTVQEREARVNRGSSWGARQGGRRVYGKRARRRKKDWRGGKSDFRESDGRRTSQTEHDTTLYNRPDRWSLGGANGVLPPVQPVSLLHWEPGCPQYSISAPNKLNNLPFTSTSITSFIGRLIQLKLLAQVWSPIYISL